MRAVWRKASADKRRNMNKKIFGVLLSAVILFTGLPMAYAAPVSPAGTTLSGDYIAVVNTGTTAQSTGTLIFDESAGTSGASAAKTAQAQGLLPEADVVYDGAAAVKGRAANPAPPYTIGTTGTFYNNGVFVCIGIGNECYVWMELGLYGRYSAENRALVGKEVAAMYDGKPSKVIGELSGGKDFYKDGSGKLSIMISEIADSTGFYAGEEGITAIHIQAVPPASYYAGAYGKYDGLIVHETQHAMFRWLACGGDKTNAYKLSWINEGLSVAAMDYYWGGDDPTGWLSLINGNINIRNGSSLIYDAYRNSSAQDYSMPDLFVRYLANRKEKGYHPVSMIKSFYNGGMTGDSIAYVNSVLKGAGLTGENGDLSFGEALADFYVAAVAQENTGRYGFYGDNVVRNAVFDYPIYAGKSGAAVNLAGSAAIILKTQNGSFTVPSGAGGNIRFIPFSKTTVPKLPSVGAGTPQDPYQIKTAEDFTTITAASGASFKLMNDIDVSGVTVFPAEEFKGVLDGSGHTITGMTKPLVGTNRGVIKNLTVNGFSGEFQTWTGVISNFNSGTISDCVVTGNVNVRFTSTKLFNLPVFGTMTSQNEMSGVIERCYTDASVVVSMPENEEYVGMIAGQNKYVISNCYAQGSLTVNGGGGTAKLSVGGIVGEQYSSSTPSPTMENCYSVTSISVNNGGSIIKKGQVAGDIQDASSVSGCYALAGALPAVGAGKTSGTTAKTAAELKMQATYAGWKFGSVWQMPAGGYPAFYVPDAVTATINKTVYYVGESLEFYNATLTVGTDKVPLTADMVETFDNATPGVKTILGSYKGISFSFSVTVQAPGNVTFLEVYTKPNISYMEGMTFDPAGTRLRATVDGRTNVYITSGYTIDQTGSLAVSDKEVVYTYGNASAKLGITVSPKQSQVTSISLMSAPAKLNGYYAGDALALDGLKVQLVYRDGSKSAIFGLNEFAANDIHVSMGPDAQVQNGAPLKDTDNGKVLYVYYGNALPNAQGSVYRAIGTLGVAKVLSLGEQVIDMTVNKDVYELTEEVTGVSSYNATLTSTLKSGAVPAGITVTLPNASNAFRFRFVGKPTTIGRTEAVYTITDQGNGRSIDVRIIFRVNAPSTACDIERFTVAQKIGIGVPSYAGRIDQATSTIKVTVPNTFNTASASYEIVASAGATGGGSAAGINFSSAKNFTITAEDGIAKKTYTVTVEKSAAAEKLAVPQNLVWDAGVAKWSAVQGADGYVVELFVRPRIDDPSYDSGISSFNVTGTECDLSAKMGKRGNYYFTVTAYVSDNSKLNSDRAQSAIYEKTAALETVSITVKAPPNQTSYYVGETFAADGMILAVTYDDGSTEDIAYHAGIAGRFTFSPAVIAADTSNVMVGYGGKTAVQPITILQKASPAASDFVMDRTGVIYDKTQQGVTVTPKSGIVGMGAVTVKYDGSTARPDQAGNYAVTIDVTEGARFKAAQGIPIGTFTINPKQLTSISVSLPSVKLGSMADNAVVQNIVCSLTSSEIYGGDVVNVTGEAMYPTTQTAGNFADAVFTTTANADNSNYTLAAGTVISGASYAVVQKDLTGITVTVMPTKTDYYVGDTFDSAGLRVMASWESGADTDVTGGVVIVADNPLRESSSKVTVRYTVGSNTFEQEIQIVVTPVILQRIEVRGVPTKTAYEAGDVFEPSGLAVTAYYNDSRKNGDVTGSCTYSPNPLTMGLTEVTVSFAGPDGGVKTAVVTGITVTKSKVLMGIDVSKMFQKTTYNIGEKIAADGLELTLRYDDGTEGKIVYGAANKNDFSFEPAVIAAGTDTVKIIYKGQNVIRPITVQPIFYRPFEEPEIAEEPRPQETTTQEPQEAGAQEADLRAMEASEDLDVEISEQANPHGEDEGPVRAAQTDDARPATVYIVLAFVSAAMISVSLKRWADGWRKR